MLFRASATKQYVGILFETYTWHHHEGVNTLLSLFTYIPTYIFIYVHDVLCTSFIYGTFKMKLCRYMNPYRPLCSTSRNEMKDTVIRRYALESVMNKNNADCMVTFAVKRIWKFWKVIPNFHNAIITNALENKKWRLKVIYVSRKSAYSMWNIIVNIFYIQYGKY